MVDFRYELISELTNNNEVVIATPFDDKMNDLLKQQIKLIEVPVDRRGINIIKDFHLLKKYIAILNEEKPDIVVTYTIKPNIYGGIACQLKRITYAANITGLGTAFQGNGIIRFVATILYRIALRKAKVVFFENSNNKEILVSLGICQEAQTCLLAGAGVNIDKFYYQKYPQNERFHFLFIGRVMKEKGIDELIKVTEELQREGFNCILDVVGPCEENYKNQLKTKNDAGLLVYHGYQEDVHQFIGTADCFVLPSWHEGMANTNLECAASGRPIITSNIPGCREALIENVSGILCEPRNENSLHSAMKAMLNKSLKEREVMGKAGRKYMEQKFDKKVVVQTTIDELLN